MKQNQKGFSVVEALLLIIIVSIVSFVGWYVWHTNHSANKQQTSTSSTDSKKEPSKSPEQDPSDRILTEQNKYIHEVTVVGGQIVSGPDKTFTVTLPQHWFYNDEGSLNKSELVVTLNKEQLTTDPPTGQISFYTNSPVSCSSDMPIRGPQDISFRVKKLTLNGVSGYRQESVNDSTSDTPGMKHVNYSFCRDSKIYVANYAQTVSEPDILSSFDAMVLQWKF